MKPPDRNLINLRHIVSYCGQIGQMVEYLENSYEFFVGSQIYRNLSALCILQIGELVGKLTDTFRA